MQRYLQKTWEGVSSLKAMTTKSWNFKLQITASPRIICSDRNVLHFKNFYKVSFIKVWLKVLILIKQMTGSFLKN